VPQTKAATRRKTPVKPRKATRDLLLDTAGRIDKFKKRYAAK